MRTFQDPWPRTEVLPLADSSSERPPLLRQRRVLIVDDHELFRQVAHRLLVDAGFDVVGEAVDGA